MNGQTEENLAWLINRIARALLRNYTILLQAAELTPSQWGVLAALRERDGQSLSELAQQSYFDGPTMTGIVDRLEQRTLVERRRHPADRRIVNVFLTGAGQDLYDGLPTIVKASNDLITQGMNQRQIEGFVAALHLIVANLGDHGGTRRGVVRLE